MNSTDYKINFKRVQESLQHLGRFSEHDLHLLTSHLKLFSITKNICLIKEGQVCQSIYFVEEGSFRQYQITDKGEEITEYLYIENDWVLDYKSFISQNPSTCNIVATEDSKVVELNVSDLHKLIKLSDAFFQVARIFQYAINLKEYQLQNATPKDRYTSLLANKPEIIQRFPLKFIASYLGMKPETLSRVRRSLA